MKILHVIPSISPLRGGPSQAVLAMVKALRECHVDAEIVTTNDNGSGVLDVLLNQRIEYEKVPVWFLPRFSPPLKEFIFSTALTSWLWQNIPNYDLLHIHYLFSYSSTCASAIARWHRIPYLLRTLDHLSPWSLTQSALKKQLYLFLIERQNLNRAAAIHCTSAKEAEDIRNFGIQTPTITLPIGIHQPVEHLEYKHKIHDIYNIPSKISIVLFLSRLHPKKRPDLLLAALQKVAAKNQKFHFIFAGTGEPNYINYLKQLVASLNLISCTSFAGFVRGENKDLLLQGSDIFVLPSFSENFGIAVAEAMAAGLPVIVTEGVQIAQEIAKANAGLVVQGEENALADAIAQLLNSPNLRQQYGENGKRLVSYHYSWTAIAQQLTTIYTNLYQG
ncbi:MAG TPA: group 1 glycosyl transferase [Cyanobacteria bacterium UBA12227]|nr:group 1 glycosyl transferase [Cyanobacteria bacterium UBA12227]HAX88429.1 group 1 glycosyl transferase [Cyanobacteria bacterium UBA11370]HBY80595.1 group 1 glycosyl transferase [Cyanobacteria bacterium UBA11148]